MKRRIVILFSLLACCLFSCVKTEVPACPEDYTGDHVVFLIVDDRSYENDNQDSDQFMPYADYISNHFHVWTNLETGEEHKSEDNEGVSGQSKRFPVSLDGIAEGPHIFTSWGNLSGLDAIVSAGAMTRADGTEVPLSGVELHPNGEESTDVYMASQSIDLTPGTEQPYMVPMERQKGLLSVEYMDFPPEITRVDVTFGPVYSHVQSDGTFTGSTSVTKSFPVTQSPPPASGSTRADEAISTLINTYVAPTIPGTQADLAVSLYRDGDTSPHIVLPAANLNVTSNVITPARVNYNVESGQWQLWVQVDGAWAMIYDIPITN